MKKKMLQFVDLEQETPHKRNTKNRKKVEKGHIRPASAGLATGTM